jgi:hypothetical protein
MEADALGAVVVDGNKHRRLAVSRPGHPEQWCRRGCAGPKFLNEPSEFWGNPEEGRCGDMAPSHRVNSKVRLFRREEGQSGAVPLQEDGGHRDRAASP